MFYSPFNGVVSVMFGIIPIIVLLVFVVVFGIIIVTAVRGAGQWKHNKQSPVLTVDAVVVAKRGDVHHRHHNAGTDGISNSAYSTTYFITFEVASGDRMEFQVRDTEYGLLVERDAGRLTFQGTRYLSFARSRT